VTNQTRNQVGRTSNREGSAEARGANQEARNSLEEQSKTSSGTCGGPCRIQAGSGYPNR
jgi:hypothetical protein